MVEEEVEVATESQKRASAKWEAENTIQVKLKLHKVHDKDIIDILNSAVNKQGYIKQLIRDDIARSGE